MKINSKVKEAEFIISDNLIIRYKKDYGFYILKEINNMWYVCTNSFKMNPHGIGFKEQYGFGYKDLKPFLFTSFNEALQYKNIVDDFEYCEFNPRTHEKIGDSILRIGRYEEICEEIIKSLK